MWRTLFGVAWFVWILDLATKIWAVSALSNKPDIKVLGSFFKLTLVRNSGAAFSFAEGATILLTIFGLFVLGGILGNLVDRIFREPGVLRGHVIDWMQLPYWPIFNIADSAIVIAALLSMVLTARNIPPITKVGS